MEVTLVPSGLGGSVRAIASKSCAHRLLICSALSDKKTFVACTESSDDIEATRECLKALGAKIEKISGGFEVVPISAGSFINKPVLNCGESGSTYRFLLPVACALGAEATFRLSGRLPQRPISHLSEALEKNGCSFEGIGESAVKSSGRLRSGVFRLPGNVSSQYISGLLFALPLLSGDSLIELSGEAESRDYISMTLSALETFKADVKTGGNRYSVRGGAKYLSPGRVEVEGDWSNAAFWLSVGAIGNSPIECRGLKPDSVQGDRAVAEILKRFGAEVSTCGMNCTVRRGRLRGTEIDAGNIPDLVPVLSAVASVSEGETLIKNAGRLRIKESDRLRTVFLTLSALGAEIKETGDGLIIRGRERLSGGVVDSFGDHRIAMTAAVASTVCEKPVTIKNAEAVNKSYPGFFEDFASLGGKVLKGGV